MKPAVLIRRLLGMSVVTKSRIGFLVAVVLLVTIGGNAAITQIDVLQENSAVICIGIALAGFISWGTGRWAEARLARSGQGAKSAADALATEHPLGFLNSRKYWGLILLVCAGMLTCVVNRHHGIPDLTVRANEYVTNYITITNVVTITNHVGPPTFPAMELAGVVLNGNKSSALINGRILHVGEMLGNVQLVSVDEEHATVELGGYTRTLVLRR
jgi:hypothetical protein